MSRPLIVRPAAEGDIEEAYHYLETTRAGVGDHFVIRLREVFERIESVSEAPALVWHDVRAVRKRTFRYVIYYVVFADRIEVLAVIHGARHESAWRSRRAPTGGDSTQ